MSITVRSISMPTTKGGRHAKRRLNTRRALRRYAASKPRRRYA